MIRGLPPQQRAVYFGTLVLSVILILLQLSLFIALAVQGVLWKVGLPGVHADPTQVKLLLGALALNGFVLARAYKAHHFLSAFGHWPGLPQESSDEKEERHVAVSAREAFHHGDYAKAVLLLQRLARREQAWHSAMGRTLVMQAEFEDAIEPLSSGGQAWAARRYLSQRRSFFLFKSRYFEPMDVQWTRRLGLLVLLSVLSAGVGGSLLYRSRVGFLEMVAPLKAGFSEKGLKSEQRGRFTFYYSDPEFMESTADKAEDALLHNLEFLKLPAESFAPGQIKIFLCADQKDYLARSPYTRSWEAASAFPEKNEIYLYKMEDRKRVYFEVVLAHELSHLCYAKLAPRSEEDSWLNEGLADYLGYKFALERIHFPRQAWLSKNKFESLKTKNLPFSVFLNENPGKLPESSIGDFYTQGFSIVYVLIEHYGRDDFLRFVQAFGHDETLAQALSKTYPTIRNAVELEAVWALFMR